MNENPFSFFMAVFSFLTIITVFSSIICEIAGIEVYKNDDICYILWLATSLAIFSLLLNLICWIHKQKK